MHAPPPPILFFSFHQIQISCLPFPLQMTVLEVRMVLNSATVQQGLVNATRAMCSHMAPYEEQCRYVRAPRGRPYVPCCRGMMAVRLMRANFERVAAASALHE